ncbi:MAG: class A beta-lactamase [Alphaproteobacteria bacterium]|nr:MAG: class A beta-lactamase [Alphaproteobacteria bacterium]
MTSSFTRRSALLSGLALGACAQTAPLESRYTPSDDDPRFAAIEARIGGRVGVAAWNTATNAWLGHRQHERFAMCSTFKWALAAHMLWIGQRQPDFLGSRVLYREADLLSYAPVTRERFGSGPMGMGEMTVEYLCEAAVGLSDNTAANLLLEGAAMGPEGFTRFLRANGDAVTRLDRYEIELNDVPPGDERDTTTPEAMARTLKRFLVDDAVLTPAHREKLIGWMVDSPTGLQRLRAGFPADWRVGDKTGTWNGEHNATNDVAIAWPPNRAPIVVAAYLSASTADVAARNAAHAEIARIITEAWS